MTDLAIKTRPVPKIRIPKAAAPPAMDVSPFGRMSPARAAAYGRQGTTVLSLEEDSAWKKTLRDREAKQHAVDTTPCGMWEGEAEFLESERRRKIAAVGQLRAGYRPIDVAPIVGMTVEEIERLESEYM